MGFKGRTGNLAAIHALGVMEADVLSIRRTAAKIHLIQAARLAGKSAVLWLGDLLWKIIRLGGSALMGAGQVDYILCLL